MTEFGSNSRELLEIDYHENGRFSDYHIISNDMSMARWDGLHLSNVVLEKNNMQQMSMQHGRYYRTDFMMSDLRSSNLSYSVLESVTFNQCSLIKMNISNSHVYNCNVSKCSAESLDMRNSRIVKTRFSMNELYKLNCENSVIINSEFTVDPENSFWGLQKAVFNKAIIINTLFHGVEYSQDLFPGSLFINCRFEN